MATADHAEGLGAVECRGARDESHGLFTGVDDIRVNFILGRVGSLYRVRIKVT